MSVPIAWDRWQLEMGEARVLAHNYKTEEWLTAALKISEKYYGKGSADRIRGYMRVIWREELLK
jgi:hypothetical protein